MTIEASAVARVVGIDTQFRDLKAGAILFLPQHIVIIGQGTTAKQGVGGYPLTKWRATGAAAGGARFGHGSLIHQALRELYPLDGSGVGTIPVDVLPLNDAEDADAAAGSIVPSGTATASGTYFARVSGVLSAPVSVSNGDTVATICDKFVAAINAVLDMPVIAADGTTDVDLTAKWAGATGNEITVEVLNSRLEVPISGLTFTITQPTAGATDPDVAPALAMLGSEWVTLVVNSLLPSDTTALGKISDAGEARWGQLVRKPFVALTGNTTADVSSATTVTAARTSDRVNAQVVAPGSVHLPVQVAAAHAREIAKVANDNPPTDYGARALRTLLPGSDADNWDYVERDTAVKAGSGTVELRDGFLRIGDVVTMYHPAGEVPPAYRYVVDIVKLQQIIYNLDLEFSKPEWAGAPLIPDGQPTVNPNAKTPSMAKAKICGILDSLGLNAIISDPATAKKNTTTGINAQNPKRLDAQTVVQLSGNTNVLSVDLLFGFFFGQATAA